MRHTLIGLAASASLLFAASSQAATYNITGIDDGAIDGFGFSNFHSQDNGQMGGSIIEDPSALKAGGTWDSSTGAISFDMDLASGGTVEVTGTLTLGTGTFGNSGEYTDLGGMLSMVFTGATAIADGAYDFIFAPGPAMPSKSGHPANGTDLQTLNLWGDLGNYGGCGFEVCIGADLRLFIEESDGNTDGNTAPVPLPASLAFLIAGLGGIAALRRRG